MTASSISASAAAAAGAQSTISVTISSEGAGRIGFSNQSAFSLAATYGSETGLVFGAAVGTFSSDTGGNTFVVWLAGTLPQNFFRSVEYVTSPRKIFLSSAASSFSQSGGFSKWVFADTNNMAGTLLGIFLR